MKTAASTPAAHVRSLQGRIGSVRRKRAVVRTATGTALALGVMIGVIAAECVIDRYADLPWVARALILAGTFAGAGFLLWRDAIRPLRRRLNEDSIALLIEHALPAFRSRFIASIQLARAMEPGTPPGLVHKLLAETAAMSAQLNFRQVIKTRKLKRALLLAVLAIAVACALGYFGRAAAPLLVKRAFLSNAPLPRKTRILTVTGDRKIGVGEDLKIEVTAEGVLPAGGQILLDSPSGQARALPLERDSGHPEKYSTVIRSPQESFKYRVVLNDDTSRTYNVVTILRPAVAEIVCEQKYPAYVDFPPVKRSPGDLSLLAGSVLKISLKATTPLKEATAHLAGLEKDLRLQIDEKDRTRFAGEIAIPPKDLTGFSIHLVNSEGVTSGESATYRINIVPDREPKVQVTYPIRQEELATAKAKLLVGFQAEDDFGITKAALHYTIDQGTEKTIDFDLSGRPQRTVMRRFDWNLGLLQPRVAVGTVIEFWVTVADANNITGPGAAATDHYQIKLVSEEEKRLDITNRVRDTMSGLNDVTQSEEELNKKLGDIIFEKPKQAP